MTPNASAGGYTLFLLAAFIPGLKLQRNDTCSCPVMGPKGPPEPQIHQPGLRPTETLPTSGTYMLKNGLGELCIKATMGAQYIVMEKQTSCYFNLEPSRVRISGRCAKDEAVLSLRLRDDAASLKFNFRKDEKNFFVTDLTAHLFPKAICKGCSNKNYSGLLTNQELFKAANGYSFKCRSEFVLKVSSELSIRLVPLQMQAFSVPHEQYGKEDVCWADFTRRNICMFLGAAVVGVVLIIILSYLMIRDRRIPGYERL